MKQRLKLMRCLMKWLNCPAEVGYETAAAVLKVNTAVEAGRKLAFEPAEFKAW